MSTSSSPHSKLFFTLASGRHKQQSVSHNSQSIHGNEILVLMAKTRAVGVQRRTEQDRSGCEEFSSEQRKKLWIFPNSTPGLNFFPVPGCRWDSLRYGHRRGFPIMYVNLCVLYSGRMNLWIWIYDRKSFGQKLMQLCGGGCEQLIQKEQLSDETNFLRLNSPKFNYILSWAIHSANCSKATSFQFNLFCSSISHSLIHGQGIIRTIRTEYQSSDDYQIKKVMSWDSISIRHQSSHAG